MTNLNECHRSFICKPFSSFSRDFVILIVQLHCKQFRKSKVKVSSLSIVCLLREMFDIFIRMPLEILSDFGQEIYKIEFQVHSVKLKYEVRGTGDFEVSLHVLKQTAIAQKLYTRKSTRFLKALCLLFRKVLTQIDMHTQ